MQPQQEDNLAGSAKTGNMAGSAPSQLVEQAIVNELLKMESRPLLRLEPGHQLQRKQ